MTKLNYQEKIPNNVDLSNDLSLQRALEHWQPKFKNWWLKTIFYHRFYDVFSIF